MQNALLTARSYVADHAYPHTEPQTTLRPAPNIQTSSIEQQPIFKTSFALAVQQAPRYSASALCMAFVSQRSYSLSFEVPGVLPRWVCGADCTLEVLKPP